MKTFLSLFYFVTLSSASFFAQVQNLSTFETTISFRLDMNADKSSAARVISTPDQVNKILGMNAFMQHNELIVKYQLDDPGPKGYYDIRLTFKMNGETIQPAAKFIIGDLGVVYPASMGVDDKKIIWTNLAQSLKEAKGTMEVTMTATWWGIQFLAYGIDCKNYPTFDFKEKSIYYGTFIGGVGAITTGLLYKKSATKHYNLHEESDANLIKEREHDKYESKLRTAKVLVFSGIGILMTDVVLYYFRNEKHKKRIRIYEENCTGMKMSFNPLLDTAPIDNKMMYGLGLTCQF